MAHEFYKQWSGDVDASNCAQEPIHLPGAIQPHGVLIGCDAGGSLVIASANCERVFGRGPDELLGCDVVGLVSRWPSPGRVESVDINGTAWLCRAHTNVQDIRILELYEAPGAAVSMEQSREAVGVLRAADSSEALLRAVVDVVQGMLGCERVMLYRFDHDDHGEIKVERVREGAQERFIGQHFPEADIPRQARELYKKQLCRSIPTVNYEYVPLVPGLLASGHRIDLSLADLRSVSPVHCSYMQNMGVVGTFTLSIVLDGRLWGLIACHHDAVLNVDLQTQEILAFITEVFTWELESLLKREHAEMASDAIGTIDDITRPLMQVDNLWEAIEAKLPELASQFDASGAALVTEDTVRTYGKCPSTSDIAHALEMAVAQDIPFGTHHARLDIRSWSSDADVCGVLACVFDSNAPHSVMFFRQEHEHSLIYGSKEDKQVRVHDGAPRLSPQGSFELHSKLVKDQSQRWSPRDHRAIEVLCERLTEAQAHHTLRLERTNQELREASAAKDQFLAALSHELRNPLNAVVGWSTLLTQGRVPSDRVDEAHRAVHRNALAQQRLIDDLLDVSRIANGKVELRTELLELGPVVDNALDVTGDAFERKNIRVHKTYSECGMVEADAERLTQVVWNLLTNAAKFTPEAGHVSVRIFPEGSWACIEVQDDGIGVAAEHIPLLFRRFHQATQLGGSQGLGLGLSIVQGLTELHGGKVSVHSDGVGTGSTFVVRLPVALRAVRETPAYTPERFRPDLHGIRAVVVDDQADAVSLLRTLLVDGGATVDVFTRPDYALSFLRTSEADVNLIVSDVNMEPYDGYEFAQQVRALPKYNLTPLVALTAYAGAQHRVRAFRAGFSAHMAKPFDTDEFIALVASITGRF